LTKAERAKKGKWNKFPVYTEGKYDGLRAVVVCQNGEGVVRSRAGHEIPRLKFFADAVASVMPDGILDAEALADIGSERAAWNATMRLITKGVVRKDGKRVADGQGPDKEIRKGITLYVFDHVDFNALTRDGEDLRPLRIRRRLAKKIVAAVNRKHKGVKIKMVTRKIAQSAKEVQSHYRQHLRAGLEGTIVKFPGAPYVADRTRAWLKVKPVHTEDARIVGFEEGDKRNAGRLGAFVIEIGGEQVNVGGGFTDKQRDEFWRKRKSLRGCWIEFEYQKDPVALRRFPVFVRMRPDRD
jgi:DNA ligase-1